MGTTHFMAGKGLGMTRVVRYVGGFQPCELASLSVWIWKSYGGVTTLWRSIKQRMGGRGRQCLGHMPAWCTAGTITASNHTDTQQQHASE